MMKSEDIAIVFDEAAHQLSIMAGAYVAGPVGVVPATAALPEGLYANLNSSLDRQLHIAVWENSATLNFVFSIVNTRTRQGVYARDLLKALGLPFSYDDYRFTSAILTSQPREIAKQMISTLTRNQKIVDILRGVEWLNVSFDWAGMR